MSAEPRGSAGGPRHLTLTGERCWVIGEVAQAHDGSLGLAHAYIDAIADAGADAVKFQTHIAHAESTPAEPWRVKFSLQDATRYEYWRRMEFTEDQWLGLRRHADERGLLFLSSPFSVEAVELLRRVGVAAWKVASGEVDDRALFDAMVQTRRARPALDRDERASMRSTRRWSGYGGRPCRSRCCSARPPIRARRSRWGST